MKKLFQYVVLLHEYESSEKGSRVFKDSKIIIEPKFTLEKSEKDVLFKVTREIPDEYTKNPDDIQIIVRNF